MLRRIGDGPAAWRAMYDGLEVVADEILDGWAPGDGLGDGLLEVRQLGSGYVIVDREAGEAAPRRVDRQVARECVLAILATPD